MLVDKNDKTVLKVERISDNCYEILSQGKSKVCNSTLSLMQIFCINMQDKLTIKSTLNCPLIRLCKIFQS